MLDLAQRTADEAEREAVFRKIFGRRQKDPHWLTLQNPLRVVGLGGRHPAFKMPADGVLDVTGLPLL